MVIGKNLVAAVIFELTQHLGNKGMTSSNDVPIETPNVAIHAGAVLQVPDHIGYSPF